MERPYGRALPASFLPRGGGRKVRGRTRNLQGIRTPAAYNRSMTSIEITTLGRFAVTVDTVPVAEAHWSRRHAAALVKVLALAPGMRLHREQVLDLLWPDEAVDEAAPKLHKAAHFARRALDVPNAVVLRGDVVALGPELDVTVDAVQFEDIARRALADGDPVAARTARDLYGGELLPDDRYELWAE